MNSKRINETFINEKWEKKWKDIKKYRVMNMEIENGIANGTKYEGGRLGTLPSTTACLNRVLLTWPRFPFNIV